MNTTTAVLPAPPQRPTPLQRASASIYDPILWLGERRTMRARRRALLAQARGRTLEIGSGTGLNLAHYPPSLDQLALAEPDAGMRRHLERRVASAERQTTVIDAPAERLPFDDGTLDTVVSTLVLCTVDSPEAALREIGRVLSPGGQLLFIEHVRAGSRVRSYWQDRLAAPWRAFASGCNCNRATLTLMAQGGYEFDVQDATWRGMPSIVKPLVYGRAWLAGGFEG